MKKLQTNMFPLILLISAKSENNACRNLFDYPVRFFSRNCYNSGNVQTTTPEMLTSNNYSYETHAVTTDDGYVLTLFRIPPKKNDNRKNKQPVFVLHGIALDSSIWVNTGNRSLAFNLANEGYDVWLGNNRGTPYSLNHTPSELYSYNLDDLATKDLKPSLEYVANVTQQIGSIIYIGHSRGGTIMTILASEFPNDVEKLLQAVVLMSPVVYFNSVSKPELEFATVIVMFAQPAVFYPSEFVHGFMLMFCTFLPQVCRQVIDARFGKTEQFLPDDLLNLFSKFPGTISFGEFLQYSQIYKSGKFQKFDYGTTKNLEVYGQETPPMYNLRNFNVPVVIYYGRNDVFTSAEALRKLSNELGSTNKTLKNTPVGNVDSRRYDFNHMDFIFSEYIQEFFYQDLFQTLRNFAN